MAHILFLCQTNAVRSVMAVAFARAKKLPGVNIYSAGQIPAEVVHPLTRQVMAEVGIEIDDARPRSLDAVPFFDIDAVITLCGGTNETCAFLLPGQPTQVNWNVPNPLEVQDENERLQAFRSVRDTIRRLVDDLYDHGYLQALIGQHSSTSVILDSLYEGVLVHDRQRRILAFNRAAEEITGFSRQEVLGRDCHEIFQPRFCGGDCSFCDGGEAEFEAVTYPVAFTNRRGECKQLLMSVRAVRDESQRLIGVLAAFTDRTREHELARHLGEITQFSGIIGRDPQMLEVYDLIRSVADSSAPVLIQGDSGTGKELVAAAIHTQSPRRDNAFVAVNCGALPEGLLESELFGHVRGAFTGAVRDKKGRFELADGGTIFLDEIGDISPAMQVKLLRVLQEGSFERVGDTRTQQVDVRVISATNRDLLTAIEEGHFREDLYYRLCVVPLTLPPLRDRRGDIPLLVQHILQRAAAQAGRGVVRVSVDAMDAMISYDWPGNVRELQNAIQYALVKCRTDEILSSDLPPALLGGRHLRLAQTPPKRRTGVVAELQELPGATAIEVEPDPSAAAKATASVVPARTATSDHDGRKRHKLDVEQVRAALNETGGNRVKATKLLGVSRATLYRFLDDHPELA